MTLAAVMAAGILLGAATAWLLQRDERKYLRDELRAAHSQIAHAVLQEGATVPPRVEPLEPLEPLTAELSACVEQWDSPESQAVEEAKIRNWLAQGWGIPAILRQYGS